MRKSWDCKWRPRSGFRLLPLLFCLIALNVNAMHEVDKSGSIINSMKGSPKPKAGYKPAFKYIYHLIVNTPS